MSNTAKTNITSDDNERVVPNTKSANAMAISNEIDWLHTILDTRIRLYFGDDCEYGNISEVPVPSARITGSTFHDFIIDRKLSLPERIVMLLALLPHVRPEFLDRLLSHCLRTLLFLSESLFVFGCQLARQALDPIVVANPIEQMRRLRNVLAEGTHVGVHELNGSKRCEQSKPLRLAPTGGAGLLEAKCCPESQKDVHLI